MDKPALQRLERLSVQEFPEQYGVVNHFVLTLATAADEFPVWGTNPIYRDRMLREFWVKEHWLASTVSALSARNAAFSWTLDGPPRTSKATQDMLQAADFGRGWMHCCQRMCIDMFTQDNGCFLEIIRETDSPTAAVIGVAHLDAGRCMRTGDLEYPVIYTDKLGRMHKMAWYRIIDITDSPSPIESMNGMQLCAVSRVLKISQVLRDIYVRTHEKLSGRFAGALHIVSGINQKMLDDVFKSAAEESDNRGRTRYQPPIIAGTLDPTAQVRKETIEITSLPEGYDEEKNLKWYIAVLAHAFREEYQELAPLPGGGLGTSTQSQILHMKAKGKGPAFWMKTIEYALNFHVLPQNVTFRFDELDPAARQAEAEVRRLRAESMERYVSVGVLTPKIVRQIMVDDGDLRQEYLDMMAEEDLTPEPTISDMGPAEGEEQEPGEDETLDDTDQAAAKELQDGDYWAGPRRELEKVFGDDVETLLGQVRRRVVARLRRGAEVR